MAQYQQLPTSYPPRSSSLSPSRKPSAILNRLPLPPILRTCLYSIFTVLVLHFAALGAFPVSFYSLYWRSLTDGKSDPVYIASEQAAAVVLDQLDPKAGQPGTFFRDNYPLRTALAFFELAEKEVREKGLDTCGGQLGIQLIDALYSTRLDYCSPQEEGGFSSYNPKIPSPEDITGPTKILCTPIKHSGFSKWWPYPAAHCFATDLRAIKDDERHFSAVGCNITEIGIDLVNEMEKERFLGSDLRSPEGEDVGCKEKIDRTLLVIGRQDQWNPFHVAEDLITTMETMLLAARIAPALVASRVQLVFTEGYGMDSNHFTPLWDRMGAWAPRRLSLDPWGEGICLSNTIHSVGAGASLLSATDIGRHYYCASTITWAASHYYRHLFSFLPPSLALPRTTTDGELIPRRIWRKPINVLWISRAKLDAHAMKENDFPMWRGIRHVNNEPELLAKFRSGLSTKCHEKWCTFQDAREMPETWPMTDIEDDQPIPLRFASIDPTVHTLETQIEFVGHASIIISSHGGALGLSLFLPPGDGTIIELQVEGVRGNYHAQHMASTMGHGYEMVPIDRNVDVDEVWKVVELWVNKYR